MGDPREDLHHIRVIQITYELFWKPGFIYKIANRFSALPRVGVMANSLRNPVEEDRTDL